MKSSVAPFLLLALAIVSVDATVHTTCFNYFMNKDKCIHSAAAENLRCKDQPQYHSTPVKAFDLKASSSKKDTPDTPPKTRARLARRYTTDDSTMAIAGGSGICPNTRTNNGTFYDSKKELGVCLWSGSEEAPANLSTAGWLNSYKTSNCNKRVFIMRHGDNSTVQYAPVVDGCNFRATKPETGCFEIGVTLALFDLFNPTPEERASFSLAGGFDWDFDNLDGESSTQAPV